MTITERITYLKQKVENPDIPMGDKIEVIEFFQTYSDMVFNNYNYESFLKDVYRLTDSK